MQTVRKKNGWLIVTAFVVTILALFALTLFAMKSGSISVSYGQVFRGLFVEYDPDVAVIYDLRFPRILIAALAGAALAVSGLLLQTALKNPLADPGIIGISGCASFAAACVTAFFPILYFWKPVFAFAGGVMGFLLIYALSFKKGLNAVRILLIGIALSSVFTGLGEIIDGMSNNSGVSLSVSGLSMRTWDDVHMLAVCVAIGLLCAVLLAPRLNLMMLDDNTVKSLGVSINVLRFTVSAVAVLLASCTTAIVGVIGFMALLAPHIARVFVGTDSRVLLPFTAILGALILLAADTCGRMLLAPYELPASTVMNICGGVFFIFLLWRGGSYHGD